ncbi:MAG: ComEA family DNA-binding protein [Candidatus Methylomirabilales bacterium]
MKLRIFAPGDAAFGALLLVVLTLVAVSGLRTTKGEPDFAVLSQRRAGERAGKKVSRSAKDVRVNPNRADAFRLTTVPGIGPALADAIVQFRARHGPFQELADLQGIPGIGPSRLKRMLPYLTLEEEVTWSTR